MNKLDLAKKCRELAEQVCEPWYEIHGLTLEADGSHNRIYGLGIKDHSMAAHDAILELARSYQADHDRETEAKYITTGDEDSDGGEEAES